MKFLEKIMQKRKFQYGANETIVVIGVLIVAILLNVVAVTLDARHPLSIDISENQYFGLTDSSKELLGSLEKDVYIYHITPPENEVPGVTEVLKNYERESDRIFVEKIDYTKDPTFVSKYTSENLSNNSLIVECDGRSEIIDYDYDITSNQTEFILESKLTNTIAIVAGNKECVVYYTGGHGESDFTLIASALAAEGMETKEINLLTEEIPENCGLLWMNAPQNDLSEEELQKVDAYLAKGGSVQVVLQMLEAPTTLANYLKGWGMTVNQDLVLEQNPNQVLDTSEPSYFLALSNEQHEITSRLANKNLLVVGASGISVTESEQFTITPLLGTSNQGVSYDPVTQTGAEGAQFVSVLSEDHATGGSLSLLTSAYVFSDVTLTSGSFGNYELLISTVDVLAEAGLTGISVEAKSFDRDNLVFTGNEQKSLFYVTFLLLPVIIFGVGLYVWQKRRHQ